MTWLKVDERFFDSPAVLQTGPVGGMVYLYGLAYCLRFNLDVFPRLIVEQLVSRQYGEDIVAEAVSGLVACGLFVEDDPGNGFPGWRIVHRWVEDDVVIEGQGEWGCAEVVAAVRAYAEPICNYCGATDELQVDHIVPRSRGGCSRPDNLQILCRPCNVRKRSTIPWGALGGGPVGT